MGFLENILGRERPGFGIRGRGVLVRPPVVQNDGDMMNPFCQTRHAQQHVPILGAGHFRIPQALATLDQLATDRHEQHDVVATEQQLRTPCRLVDGIDAIAPRREDIAVRVHDIHLRIARKGVSDRRQGVPVQGIVRIGKQHNVAAS